MKILILCKHNEARSQMLEGYLKALLPQDEIFSAGAEPAQEINPLIIEAMAQDNIDIRNQKSKSLLKFLKDSFDYVITVCEEPTACKNCPLFLGETKHRIYLPIPDPLEPQENQDKQLERIQQARTLLKEFAHQFIKNYR